MYKQIQDASTWAIETHGLEKYFANHQALRGIDLQVSHGKRLVIFGPNGAGKTTLLKILSTLVKPSAGNVKVDGIDIRDQPVQIRRKISLVSHHTFLYDDLTVYENLRFYGKMYDVANLDEKIREVISWVKLESRLHDRVGTLSRGLQQRVSVVRAVLHNPSVLFLDEPEVGLDPHVRSVISDILCNTSSSIRTVLMTTHNLEQGLNLGDSVAIINRGKIVYQASTAELDKINFQQVYDHYTESNA